MSDQRIHHGRCLDCGDEWTERGEIVVCPECHSRNVVEAPPRDEHGNDAEGVCVNCGAAIVENPQHPWCAECSEAAA